MANKEIFFKACKDGSLDIIEKLLTPRKLLGLSLNAHANVSDKDLNGRTALHYAVNHVEIIDFLLSKGADINEKDNEGNTPLIESLRPGSNKNTIEYIIEKGADLNLKNNKGDTPLHKACMWTDIDFVKLLIEKGADINATNHIGNTPLHEAVFSENIEAVKLLVIRGADVNAKNNDGTTPLLLLKEQLEIFKFLISSGADVNAKDSKGITAMHRACSMCNKMIVELLIKNGADINSETNKGVKPLMVILNSQTNNNFGKSNAEYEDLIELLIKNGAVLNSGDKSFWPSKTTASSAEDQAVLSPQDFAEKAINGSVKWRINISQIPKVVSAINKKLQESGIPSNEIYDLFNNSLLSVCPVCNNYCAGKALLSLEWMVGSNTLFTGNSGGFERILEGRCLNYSCNSTEHELFWCPDLNPQYLAELNSRGINIDPNIQSTRDHVWKPKV